MTVTVTRDEATKTLKAEVVYDRSDIDGNAAKREEMIKRSGRTTVPQIFIDAQHIGGCDDLYALDARGGLDPLLK